MDPNQFIKFTKSIIVGYTEKYDKFLDDRTKEYLKRVKAKSKKKPVLSGRYKELEKDAMIRQSLLLKAIYILEECCRRDFKIPEFKYEKALEILEKLDFMREEVGAKKHPTILAIKGKTLALNREYKKAIELFRKSIDLNSDSSKIKNMSDNVCLMGELSRCLYLTDKYEEAIAIAKKGIKLAESISSKSEGNKLEYEEYIKKAASTENFVPSIVYSLFTACDVRINHIDWRESEQLKSEFNGYWIESLKYDAPKSWSIPMKIAVLSDINWSNRMQSYVKGIAEELYLDLSPVNLTRMARLIQSRVGGFSLISKDKAAALCLFFLLFSAAPDISYSPKQVLEGHKSEMIDKFYEKLGYTNTGDIKSFTEENLKEDYSVPILETYKINIEKINFDNNENMFLAMTSGLNLEDV